jgi:anti-anti-sigma factor
MVRPSPFDVHSELRGDSATLRLFGELDMATMPELEDVLAAMLSRGVRRLIVDLSQLGFIDSSGLRLLIALADRAGAEGWTLGLVRPAEHVRTVFEVTGADEKLPFLEDPPAS